MERTSLGRFGRQFIGAIGAVALAALALSTGCACGGTPGQPAPKDDQRFTYTAKKYIPPLDEIVIYRKTPGRSVVERRDGRIQSVPEFENTLREAHVSRHGALRGGFASWLEKQPADKAVPIAVYCGRQGCWDATVDRIPGMGHEAERARRRSCARWAADAGGFRPRPPRPDPEARAR